MRRFILLCAIAVYWPALLCAGPVYGTILFSGGPLRRATVTVTCSNRVPVNGYTLDDGSYRLSIPQEGHCTFTVTSAAFQGGASADILSLPNAAQYNFAVVRGANGRYELRRQ